MAKAEALTANNTAMTLVIAANYGGQWDITQAARRLAEKVSAGELRAEQIDEELLQSQMCLGDLPMPDLMVRTAGEQRVSNFMLWQLAYAEFVFSDLYWPDFKSAQMLEALTAYGQRKRRFGQTDDQINNK